MKKSLPKTPVKKKPPAKKARAAQTRLPRLFPVVGIGASAGGLEASSDLLQNIAPDLGMAYVIVHHLSPDYDSNLTELLQRKTSMPVERVDETVLIEPDHVYVIPPNKFICFEDGHLKTLKRSKLDVPYHPIDFFLVSLAHERHDYAIGILLSGTATDGTLGLKAIKEEGGITFTQDKTAKHTQMPRNAQQAGYADFVLSPPHIAEELKSLTRHPYTVVTPNELLVKNEEAIKRILDIVLQKCGVDFFSHYKRTTVYRRIMRRMALLKIVEFGDYFKKLRNEDEEVEALYHDFLINVTSFFREPAFFKSLIKTVFPQVVKSLRPAEPIRIWVAGCATGEEAYSTAICLLEFLQEKKLTHSVNIFSTDLNGKAIEKARLGIYPKSLLQHISPERLQKFFVRIDGHYQVIKSVREMCIFSQHNLLKDPPFSRIDLVSCQNVLIYLEASPQRKIFQSFHYALKPQGFLLVGKSESIGNVTDLFQAFEKDSRLYKKKALAMPRLELGMRPNPVSSASILPASSTRLDNDIERESDKVLLARYVPASVLVNKDLDIIRFRGATSTFLEPASGKASLNLLKMAKDELLFDLRAGLQKARKSGVIATQENVILDGKQKGLNVSIEVSPLKSGKDQYFLIVFREVLNEAPLPVPKGKPIKQGEQRAKILKLEQALVHAREQIRATSDDFEATREELQSANEEILSSNEELQSINEELETSKEELQSSNEELTTINEELQNRNVELKQARDYAEAIIETMRGPLMVLNREMRVRMANRAFYDFFKLTQEETEGAFIYEIGDRQWSIPALRDQLQEIHPRKLDFKDFMISHDFPRIGNRTMIVNAHRLLQDEEGNESLILLAFEDITRYKKAEQALVETQEQLKLALGGASVGTWVWDMRTNEIEASAEEQLLYGLSGNSMKSYQDWERAIHPLDLQSTRRAIEESIKKKKPLDFEFRILWPDGSTHWILFKANTYYDESGNPEKMMGVNIDMTLRKTAIEALEESEMRFHTMSDNAPVMIWMTGPDKQTNFLNKTWLSFTGKTLEEESGHGWFEGIHPEDRQAFVKVFDEAFERQQHFKIDHRLKRHDGEYMWIMNQGVPRFTGENRFIGFLGTCIDINDRIDLERQKDDFMGIASHELKTPVTSIKAYAQILQEKFRRANDEASVNMLTRLDLQIDKLTGLINTLLDVAKMQSGQMDYFQEFFDIREFILEATEELQRAYQDHKIVTNLKTGGRVFADKSRLAQVLSNLISNAVKYSPDGKQVVINASRQDGQFVFSVQDFGVGINKDMQEKVFGRFFRVSESSGNRVSGLGLGLFIASQIVVQQGGKLWLGSQPGKGSTFYFSLPVKEES